MDIIFILKWVLYGLVPCVSLIVVWNFFKGRDLGDVSIKQLLAAILSATLGPFGSIICAFVAFVLVVVAVVQSFERDSDDSLLNKRITLFKGKNDDA